MSLTMWSSTTMAVLQGTRLYLKLTVILLSQLSLILSAIPSQSCLSLRSHISLEGALGRTFHCVSVNIVNFYLCSWLYLLGSPEGVLVGVSETGSIRVSWEAVENAEYYTVSFSQAAGDDQEGLCRGDSHSASLNVTDNASFISVGDNVGSDETHILRAYTTYSVTVVAFSDVWGRTVGSEAFSVTTPQRS